MGKNDVLVGIGSLLAVLIFLSLIQRGATVEEPLPKDDPAPVIKTESITYRGTLPCADCQGVETQVRLTREIEMSHGTFVLRENFIGKSSVETTGTWETVTGNKKDPKATIVILSTEKQAGIRNFLQTSDGRLILLDSERNGIPSRLNYTLVAERSPP